jgi:tripartite-type tricarboxylate transporter receptor subunit TctC
MPHTWPKLVATAACATTAASVAAQSADGYPAQAIRSIVPYSPGG